jgi:hypothetical protein
MGHVRACTHLLHALRALEQDNGLGAGDILSAAWIKPVQRRSENQVRANLKVEFRSMEVADKLIRHGARIDYMPVPVRRLEEDPLRCLKCQKFGHMAAKCKESSDTCSQCGGPHHFQACDQKEKMHCVSCGVSDHCSWDRKCPAFRDARDRLNARKPDNRRRFFNPVQPHYQEEQDTRDSFSHFTFGDVQVGFRGSRRGGSPRQATLFETSGFQTTNPGSLYDNLPPVTWGNSDSSSGTWGDPPTHSPREASLCFPLRPRSRASSISSTGSVATYKAYSPSGPIAHV